MLSNQIQVKTVHFIALYSSMEAPIYVGDLD